MAKERRKREKVDVKGSKPITWYAAPRDRNSVDEIALAEETKDGRPFGATHIVTLAVRCFSNLYKTDPDQALSLARQAADRRPTGRA